MLYTRGRVRWKSTQYRKISVKMRKFTLQPNNKGCCVCVYKNTKFETALRDKYKQIQNNVVCDERTEFRGTGCTKVNFPPVFPHYCYTLLLCLPLFALRLKKAGNPFTDI